MTDSAVFTRKANKTAKLIFDLQDKMWALLNHEGCNYALNREIDSFLMNASVDDSLLELKGFANSKPYLDWLRSYEEVTDSLQE